METTIEVFREEIRKLVEKFERDKYFYLSKQYLEAQARQDFIDRFFEALGWDIGNKAELSPFEREVLLEKGETKGRPDYNFRVGGASKFYVEAKAPSEPLDKTAHIMQAKSYAWNTKDVFIVVLTDFEEFKVFDASLKPDPRNPNLGLIYDFKYTDYLKKLDDLWMLSRDEVVSGSLDKLLLKDAQSKRLRIPVDKSFLSDMTGWREELAKDLYKRNPDINVIRLNEVVQRILDRFVFIRTAEDRKIIEPKSLLELVELWKREGKRRPLQYHLNILFRQINGDLNGEIFKPHACETYEFDSTLLAKIIEGLYFPKCPYRFDIIGVELLGSIYERYLGNTIRLTAKRVKVEEKPEVRKAGGVYYTPKYIVDYIVDNTVGKLIEGKTPEEIAEIKILDPACGSGSFLLGAYQKLIDYHIKYYTEHPAEAGRSTLFPDLIIDPDGSHRLSITKKAEILQNNIFGVDIDPQAVEVSMMSLYIKALEGERTLPQNKELLPSLANNIKCGNSLIGYDFFEQQTLIEDEERERINPFDWNSMKAGFGDIMEKGGFDCVVGNPPYFNIDDTWGKGDARQRYIKYRYYSVYNDKTDILFYFLTKAVELCKGEIGVIVSRAFLEAYKADKLRSWLAGHGRIRQIIDFQNYYVFDGVGITTAILLLSKCDELEQATIHRLIAPRITSENLAIQVNKSSLFQTLVIGQDVFGAGPWLFASSEVNALLQKIDREGEAIGSILTIGQGMQTGQNNVFGKLSKSQLDEWGVEPNQRFVRARNSDIQRYHIHDSREMLLYLENVRNFGLLPNGVQQYLRAHEGELKARAAYKRGDCDWWRYTWPLHKEHLLRHKLYCPYLATFNRFAMDIEQKYLGLTDTTVLFESEQPEDLRYFLSLLNSRLLTFRFRYIGKLKSGGILEYFWNSVSKLPIHRINFSNPEEVAKHDKLVALVDRMLELNSKKNALPPSSERERIEREIAVTDEKIDEIVYGLYGLTEEEIRVVEEHA